MLLLDTILSVCRVLVPKEVVRKKSRSIDDDFTWMCKTMLCCFLQGNLQFVDDEKDQASVVNSDEELNVLSYLLGSEPRLVEKALCYRVVAAAGSEVLDKGHHAKEASHGRDALAKVNNNHGNIRNHRLEWFQRGVKRFCSINYVVSS